MEDSEDEVFWGPISEREREVVKCSLLRDISECCPTSVSCNEDRTSISVISQSLGSVESDSASISSEKPDRWSTAGVSKSDSEEVCDVSLCGRKLAALTNTKAIDSVTDSVLLECSSDDSVDCSSESDCLNDTLEEVESIMKRAFKIMHRGENSKEIFKGENRSSEPQDLEPKNLFRPNVEGVPQDLKSVTSHYSNCHAVKSSSKVNVDINASPRKVTEKNASLQFKRIPQRDCVKNRKEPQKKHNFMSIESPIAEYIKYRPVCLLKNVKVKDNVKRDMPLPTLPIASDENVRHLTPTQNTQTLPVVKYDRAPVVNMNYPRFIEKNILPKTSSATPKVIKHTGRALLASSPSRAKPNLGCNEVSVVYEKNVSVTNSIEK